MCGAEFGRLQITQATSASQDVTKSVPREKPEAGPPCQAPEPEAQHAKQLSGRLIGGFRAQAFKINNGTLFTVSEISAAIK